jgi:hypothetical protein
MISLLQQYKRTLIWFISGLVAAILISVATSYQQPASAYVPSASTIHPRSEFAASHQELNFYQ